MSIKQFLLFSAPKSSARKQYVASFDSRDSALEGAEKIKPSGGPMRWQIIDGISGEVVAEDPGSE